jgi:hypothetical protein
MSFLSKILLENYGNLVKNLKKNLILALLIVLFHYFATYFQQKKRLIMGIKEKVAYRVEWIMHMVL